MLRACEGGYWGGVDDTISGIEKLLREKLREEERLRLIKEEEDRMKREAELELVRHHVEVEEDHFAKVEHPGGVMDDNQPRRRASATQRGPETVHQNRVQQQEQETNGSQNESLEAEGQEPVDTSIDVTTSDHLLKSLLDSTPIPVAVVAHMEGEASIDPTHPDHSILPYNNNDVRFQLYEIVLNEIVYELVVLDGQKMSDAVNHFCTVLIEKKNANENNHEGIEELGLDFGECIMEIRMYFKMERPEVSFN